MNISRTVLVVLVLGVGLAVAMSVQTGVTAIDRLAEADAKLEQASAKMTEAEDREKRADMKLKQAEAKLAAEAPEAVADRLAEADAKLADAKDRERRADAQFQAANDAFKKANAKSAEPEPTCDELFDQYTLYSLSTIGAIRASAVDPTLMEGTFLPYAEEYTEISQELVERFVNGCSVTDDQVSIATALKDTMRAAPGNTDASAAGSQRTHTSCAMFCDSTGYEPQWTKIMSEMQATSKCGTVFSDLGNIGTRDYDWCSEFLGYQLDNFN